MPSWPDPWSLRTSTPAAKLRALQALSEAGVPVGLLIAPVIPGLNDSEIPAILKAGQGRRRTRGRLYLAPPAVHSRPGLPRLARKDAARPLAADRGTDPSGAGRKLNDPNFGSRMSGTGELAQQIGELFRLFARRYGLDGDLPAYDCTQFRPPLPQSGQLRLF